MSTVYLNGKFLPKEGAQISVEDRGFLLSDGVYEVTPAYWGKFFRLEGHLDRLRGGLASLRIDYDPEELINLIEIIDMGVADVVYGSRFLGGGKYVRIHFFWHYIANKLLTFYEQNLPSLSSF